MPAAAAAVAAGLATGPGSRVTRFAKSTAASVTPVRPGKSHALSPLDNAMERHTVHLVLYYRAAPGMDRERLKESLSEVLSMYPAMTGRLTRAEEGAAPAAVGAPALGDAAAERGWVVKCNDAGVRMVDARVAGSLDEWFATATGDEEMDLVYFEPMGAEPYIWSPFYVQLTEFTDKSYALGLSCTHIHNDPTAAALFFHGWAAAHRRTTSSYPPFLHAPALAVSPASPPPPPPLLATKSSAASSAADAAAMSSATFHFSAAAMRELLSTLEPGATPFAALAALFWTRVATGAGDGEERELTLALDFRKRMHAPLPTGYYGSAVHFTRARADLASGLPAVAASLDRHVASASEDELWAALEWLHARQQQGEEPFEMYGPELTCMALDHVPMYGAEFELGAPPARVACRVGGAAGEGLVIVLPAAEGAEARDVVVTLPAEVTARVCGDDEVLRYGAKVVFGRKKVEKEA